MICELLEKASEIRPSKIKVTYRQPLPNVCQQQFHGQDEDRFRIFWDNLVEIRLRIMREEGFCEVRIFRFLRSESSILEVPKMWGRGVEMSPYLRRYKYLMKEVYW